MSSAECSRCRCVTLPKPVEINKHWWKRYFILRETSWTPAPGRDRELLVVIVNHWIRDRWGRRRLDMWWKWCRFVNPEKFISPVLCVGFVSQHLNKSTFSSSSHRCNEMDDGPLQKEVYSLPLHFREFKVRWAAFELGLESCINSYQSRILNLCVKIVGDPKFTVWTSNRHPSS